MGFFDGVNYGRTNKTAPETYQRRYGSEYETPAMCLTRNSVERHERARVQIKSEVMENRQIDYKSHMKWLKN